MTDSTTASVIVRPAADSDLDAAARLAGELVRLHHRFDPKRFFLPENVEKSYRWWLGKELAGRDAILLVAELGGRVVGYVYGRVEDRDWNMLLEKHAALHDVLVDDTVRRRGVAEALVDAFAAEAKRRGAPRIVLSAAHANTVAQALFEKLGFRRTMVEMTRELE
jgi:ribosomal protein S18 acetylase RimI-like enzyme